jgi:hypothetical protein
MKLIITFLFAFSVTFAQSPLKKDFLETLDYNNLKTWTTCNVDSAFFKSDTIYLDDSFDYVNCKEQVTWHFANLKSFWQVSGRTFENGMGETKVMTEKDHYKIKIIENKNETLLKVYNKRILIETYQILSAGYDSKLRNNRLTLKRIRMQPTTNSG